MPLWRQPSPICRVMLNALIPNGIDRRGARNWVSNPALRTMTESSLQRPLKYLPMCGICTTVVFINERFIKINQYPPALVEYFLFQKVGSAGFDHIVSFTKRGMPLHKTMKNLPLIQTAS